MRTNDFVCDFFFFSKILEQKNRPRVNQLFFLKKMEAPLWRSSRLAAKGTGGGKTVSADTNQSAKNTSKRETGKRTAAAEETSEAIQDQNAFSSNKKSRRVCKTAPQTAPVAAAAAPAPPPHLAEAKRSNEES